MDYTMLGTVTLLAFSLALTVDATSRCYTCAGISNPHDCQTVTACTVSQQCFTRSYISDVLTVKFDLGCQDNDFCSVLSKRSSLSGLLAPQVFTHNAMTSSVTAHNAMTSSVTAHSRRKRQLEAPLCTQCCDIGEHCNIDLCKNSLVSRPPGLKCYDCGNTLLDDPSQCNTVRVCSPDQRCHVSEVVGSTGSKFVVKCLSDVVCNILGDSILFGKRRKRDRYLCHACCDTDHCNIDYCSRLRPLPTGITKTTAQTTPTTSTTPASTTRKTLHLVSVQKPYNVTREAESFPLSYACQVTGLPLPTYSWDFTDINGQARNVDNLAKNQNGLSILTLDPVLPKDEGTYTCIANNSLETLETSGRLTVFTKVVSKTPQDQTLTPKEGEDATLKCVFDSYPKETITWYGVDAKGDLDNTTVLNVSANQETVTFAQIDRNQSGQYACVGDNGFRQTTNKFSVDVTYPPKFKTTPSSVLNVTEHGRLEFSCFSEGNPLPNYGFSFVDSNSNNVIVTGATIFNFNGTLVINDVSSRYDKGTLTCRVQNTDGFVEHSVAVNVL